MENIIRVAVVDDAKSAVNKMMECLERYSSERGIEFSVRYFTNPLDFLENYEACYDIIFMDIEMPEYDGISAMKRIRAFDKNTILIYITNMANMAIKCYEVDALDFIVKPVEYFSFSVKMDRAVSRLRKNKEKELLIRTTSGTLKVFASQIIYLEVIKHAVVYHTAGGDFLAYGTLKQAEKLLGEHGFARCHNCYLVNLRHVVKLEDNSITLDGAEGDLLISKSRKRDFIAAWTDFINKGK